MSDSKRREKDRLPKDVSKLTGEEVMRKVFNKRVVEKLKKVAHDDEEGEPESQ